MSSFVLVYKGVVHSKPISHEEAVSRQVVHAKYGMDYEIVAVDEEIHVAEKVDHGPAEIVEDVGCAGGACTL